MLSEAGLFVSYGTGIDSSFSPACIANLLFSCRMRDANQQEIGKQGGTRKCADENGQDQPMHKCLVSIPAPSVKTSPILLVAVKFSCDLCFFCKKKGRVASRTPYLHLPLAT